jgi:LysM repeat protein
MLVIIGVSYFVRTSSSKPVPVVIPLATTTPLPSPLFSPTLVTTPITTTPTVRFTETITFTLATPTVPRGTAAFVRYKVRLGDTLSAIAETYHVSVSSIIRMNGLRTEMIYEGQELLIPVPSAH